MRIQKEKVKHASRVSRKQPSSTPVSIAPSLRSILSYARLLQLTRNQRRHKLHFIPNGHSSISVFGHPILQPGEPPPVGSGDKKNQIWFASPPPNSFLARRRVTFEKKNAKKNPIFGVFFFPPQIAFIIHAPPLYTKSSGRRLDGPLPRAPVLPTVGMARAGKDMMHLFRVAHARSSAT